jgi:murein DD-endopeptidase MepM/ murein hydrolase activator NlpD
MSEDQHYGAEGLFKRGKDAAVGLAHTKAVATMGAIGTKALLGGFALMKGAVVLAGKSALLAIKAIILKMGITAAVAIGGIGMLGLSLGLMVYGALAGASGREAAFREATSGIVVSAMREAPEDTKWFPQVSLEQHTAPWGLLEAIDILDGPPLLNEDAMAYSLALEAHYEPTTETEVSIGSDGETITTVVHIHLLKRVDAWDGEYRFIYTKERAECGSTFYVFTRADFTPSWERLDNVLNAHFGRTLEILERDKLVAMGVSATYGEPSDIVASPISGVVTGAPIIVGDFAFPIIGQWRVTSPFGDLRGRLIPHRGLDLAAVVGTPLVAVTDGTVQTGRSMRGGNIISLRGDNGMRFLYAHLSGFAVRNGTHVTRGSVIGFVGNTGFSTGPHLHIEFIMPDGNRIDPAPHLIVGIH